MKFAFVFLLIVSNAWAEDLGALDCKQYPPTKKFKWGVRGEVGLPELVGSMGALRCAPIVYSQALVSRAGKVTLEVPDLLTAPEVQRLFHAALDSMGLTI